MEILNQEQMNIVVIGHVDHGKSTVVGRLLADTNSLPEGKLEQVKTTCLKNSKPFEYAYLLDALKDEQIQGITIDSARCFFKSKKRHYIIIDAPGHIEFLKNMVSGAARAEAAFLVIDAHEGIQENSRRHGYLASLLGIKQVVILVNKMDLTGYSEKVFENIKTEFDIFLKKINVQPVSYIPISAREGVNIIANDALIPWYTGYDLLSQLDAFQKKTEPDHLAFRMPVQDIYKFTGNADERRIIAGTIEAGTISAGDEVIVFPTEKRTRIKTIETFNAPVKMSASAGEAVGFTFATQIYLRPGHILAKAHETPPQVSSRLRVNLFWMGKAPLIKGKQYKLKLATQSIGVKLDQILNVIDASELDTCKEKQQIDRHDVSECILETTKPIAFDLIYDLDKLGRFVIVDNYDVAGGGIIIQALGSEQTSLAGQISEREQTWEKSKISPAQRSAINKHQACFIFLTGLDNHAILNELAQNLEYYLFQNRFNVYYLGIKNIESGLNEPKLVRPALIDKEMIIEKLGESSRLFADAGLIFIAALENCDDFDIERLNLLNTPYEVVLISVGDTLLQRHRARLSYQPEETKEEVVKSIVTYMLGKEILSDFII